MKRITSTAGVAALALTLAACGGGAEEASDTEAPAEETAAADDAAPVEQEDALVEGTDYNATTLMPCGFDGKPPELTCEAGVKRNWGDTPGEHLVEVSKPDGSKRAIFFKGTEPYGADSAQADGSAGWDFSSTRDGDQVTITYGPETYVVVDALIEGG